MQQAINKIETIVNDDIKKTHSEISKTLERLVFDENLIVKMK